MRERSFERELPIIKIAKSSRDRVCTFLIETAGENVRKMQYAVLISLLFFPPKTAHYTNAFTINFIFDSIIALYLQLQTVWEIKLPINCLNFMLWTDIPIYIWAIESVITCSGLPFRSRSFTLSRYTSSTPLLLPTCIIVYTYIMYNISELGHYTIM